MPRPSRLLTRVLKVAVGVGLVLGLAGCKDEDKIVIQNPVAENRAPLIVDYGPKAPGGVLDQVSRYGGASTRIWALVGDPDGLTDISLVKAKLGSARLTRMIMRPDTSVGGCSNFGFGPADTIAISSVLTLPLTLPGDDFMPLTREQGGLYSGALSQFPDLVSISDTIDEWPGGCLDNDGIYGPIVVIPPALPARKDAIVSLAEIEYNALSIVVYDKVGATDSVDFPPFRVVYRTDREPAPIP